MSDSDGFEEVFNVLFPNGVQDPNLKNVFRGFYVAGVIYQRTKDNSYLINAAHNYNKTIDARPLNPSFMKD